MSNTRGIDNVVADALSHVFKGQCPENPELICAGMLGSLPLVYSSLQKHQRDGVFCEDLRKRVENKESGGIIIKSIMVCSVISPRRLGDVSGSCSPL
jgi:hypothetical protein